MPVPSSSIGLKIVHVSVNCSALSFPMTTKQHIILSSVVSPRVQIGIRTCILHTCMRFGCSVSPSVDISCAEQADVTGA